MVSVSFACLKRYLCHFLGFFFFPPKEIVSYIPIYLVCLWEKVSLDSSYIAILNQNLNRKEFGDKTLLGVYSTYFYGKFWAKRYCLHLLILGCSVIFNKVVR